MNVELKYFDTAASAQNITETGTVVPLDNVPQGDTGDTRDGAQIRCKSQYMIFNMGSPGNASQLVQRVRVMVISDFAPNGGVPLVTDLVESVDVDALRNMSNRRRFRVHYDRVFLLGTVAGGGGGNGFPIARFIKRYFKIDQTKVFEDPTSGSPNQIQSGPATYLIYFGDATSTYPTVDFSVRMRYIDN